MARFGTWRGPTVNKVTGGMREWRGVVIHIAEGSYEGTISWQKNPSSQVSSHFVVDYDGTIGQVVDTADTAWTQQAGNGHWISVENAGHSPNPLTAEQEKANAAILKWAHDTHGVLLQLANDPNGHGLGHHSMGTNGHQNPTDTWTGATWGHEQCPGSAIYAQKPTILALAKGTAPLEVDMSTVMLVKDGSGKEYWSDTISTVRPVVNHNDDFYRFLGKVPGYPAHTIIAKNFNGAAEPYGEAVDSPTYEDLISIGYTDMSKLGESGGGSGSIPVGTVLELSQTAKVIG